MGELRRIGLRDQGKVGEVEPWDHDIYICILVVLWHLVLGEAKSHLVSQLHSIRCLGPNRDREGYATTRANSLGLHIPILDSPLPGPRYLRENIR